MLQPDFVGLNSLPPQTVYTRCINTSARSPFMKRSILLFSIIVSITAAAGAQVRPPVPRPSQKATVLQQIGTTDVSITYSRPAVKGRTIFADPTAEMAARAKGEATLDDQN